MSPVFNGDLEYTGEPDALFSWSVSELGASWDTGLLDPMDGVRGNCWRRLGAGDELTAALASRVTASSSGMEMIEGSGVPSLSAKLASPSSELKLSRLPNGR